MTERCVCFYFLLTEWQRGVWRSLHKAQTAGQSQDGFPQQTDNRSERTRWSSGEFKQCKLVSHDSRVIAINIPLAKNKPTVRLQGLDFHLTWMSVLFAPEPRQLFYRSQCRAWGRTPRAEEQVEWGRGQQQRAPGATADHRTAPSREGNCPCWTGDIAAYLSIDFKCQENALSDRFVMVLVLSCGNCRLWSVKKMCVSRNRSRNMKKSCWASQLSHRMTAHFSRCRIRVSLSNRILFSGFFYK